MPAFPGMPPLPSISAGGGGPSSALSNTYGGGGFDSSGWAVNIGQGTQGATSSPSTSTSTSTSPSQSVAYRPDQFGLPNAFATGGGIQSSASGQAVSPIVLILALVVVAFAIKRHG